MLFHIGRDWRQRHGGIAIIFCRGFLHVNYRYCPCHSLTDSEEIRLRHAHRSRPRVLPQSKQSQATIHLLAAGLPCRYRDTKTCRLPRPRTASCYYRRLLPSVQRVMQVLCDLGAVAALQTIPTAASAEIETGKTQFRFK